MSTLTPYLQDADCTLYNGDVLEVLRQLPDETFHMACTSPPFYGLRDYGTGSWEGGDEGCDHDQRRRERDTNSKQATSAGSSRDGVAGSTHCRKCGARRVDQQIGLEATPDEWVARLVEVFREVRRVLRADGTCWVEIGDSYAGSWGAQSRESAEGEVRGHLTVQDRMPGVDGSASPSAGISATQIKAHPKGTRTGSIPAGAPYKPKDMVGAPWLLAFALRADGWYLRSEIIWAKPNPMPESVTDRPTVSHSRVFLLAKSPRYFYDASAIAESPALPAGATNGTAFSSPTLRPEVHATVRTHDGTAHTRGWHDLGESKHAVNFPMAADAGGFQVLDPVGLEVGVETPEGPLVMHLQGLGGTAVDAPPPVALKSGLPLLPPVWASVADIATSPSGAFLASESSDVPSVAALARAECVSLELACIAEDFGAATLTLASDELRATLLVWGSFRPAHTRSIDPSRNRRSVWTIPTQPYPEAHFATWPERLVEPMILAGSPEDGIVLDPFAGSGTTLHVARRLGRRSVGVELNPDYCELASRRLQQQSLFAEPYEPPERLPQHRGLTGGAYSPPGQSPHSNARKKTEAQ